MRLTPTTTDIAPVAFEGSQDNVILGRMPRQGVTIEHQTVSREHARVFRRDGTWQVADLNSSNGTFVNGQKVSRHALAHGDLLRLGELEFQVDLAAPGGKTAPAPPKGRSQPSEADIFGDADPAGDDGGIVLEDPVITTASASTSPSPSKTAGSSQRTAGPLSDQTMVVQPQPMFRGPTSGPASGAARPKAMEHMALKTRDQAGAGGSVLKQDVSQFGVMRQALMVIAALAISAGLFYLVMQLTEQVVPEGGLPDAPASEDP